MASNKQAGLLAFCEEHYFHLQKLKENEYKFGKRKIITY